MSLYDDSNPNHVEMRERWRDRGNEVTAELARVKALFQARTVAMVVGAPMPDPEAFRRPSPDASEADKGGA